MVSPQKCENNLHHNYYINSLLPWQDLRKPVDEFMAGLTPDQAYWRANYGVTDYPYLYQLFSEAEIVAAVKGKRAEQGQEDLTEHNAGDRCESITIFACYSERHVWSMLNCTFGPFAADAFDVHRHTRTQMEGRGGRGTERTACSTFRFDIASWLLIRLYLRNERQTFKRLPKTGAVLFTIRTYVRHLREIADRPELCARLGNALSEMPDDFVSSLSTLGAMKWRGL